jgi:hypothetical protein
MDIRTKLALALVFVGLASMVLLGLFAYRTAAVMLQQVSARQLDALAESKSRDLTNVIEGWEDRVRLIGSRTQLRLSLQAYGDGDASVLVRLQRILADAEQASPEVHRIALFDRRGRLLVTAGSAEHEPDAAALDSHPDVDFSHVYYESDGAPNVAIVSELMLDGSIIGGIEVVLDAADVASVASNFTGLGRTGEVLVLARDEAGAARLLHARRHGEAAGESLDAPYVSAALEGREAVFTEGVFDDRGKEVWAATRFVPQLAWGVVVKVDAEEELEPVAALRSDMIDLWLALGAFAIAGGTLLGFYLGRPIRKLADVVVRLRQGEVGLRADVRGDDEVAVLSKALNDWMDDLDGRAHRGGER